jgi:hypothetical protein
MPEQMRNLIPQEAEARKRVLRLAAGSSPKPRPRPSPSTQVGRPMLGFLIELISGCQTSHIGTSDEASWPIDRSETSTVDVCGNRRTNSRTAAEAAGFEAAGAPIAKAVDCQQLSVILRDSKSV